MIGYGYAGPSEPEFNRQVGDFVSHHIFGEPGKFNMYCSMAVIDKEQMIAGVVYTNYYADEGVIELFAAATNKRWLTRPIMRAMFALPFERLGCQLCVLRVSEHNHAMLRIALAYGFNEYVIPRLGGRNEAKHIMTLSDDDWRSNRFTKGHT